MHDFDPPAGRQEPNSQLHCQEEDAAGHRSHFTGPIGHPLAPPDEWGLWGEGPGRIETFRSEAAGRLIAQR